jgi:hypothetical protein
VLIVGRRGRRLGRSGYTFCSRAETENGYGDHATHPTLMGTPGRAQRAGMVCACHVARVCGPLRPLWLACHSIASPYVVVRWPVLEDGPAADSLKKADRQHLL